MYATALVYLLHMFGLDFDEGAATELVLAVLTMVSFAVWVYGQLDRKDLKLGLFRK